MKHFKKIMCLLSTLCILIAVQIPSLPVYAGNNCDLVFDCEIARYQYVPEGDAEIYIKNKKGIACTETNLSQVRDNLQLTLNRDDVVSLGSNPRLDEKSGRIIVDGTIKGEGTVTISLQSKDGKTTYSTMNLTIGNNPAPSSDSSSSTPSEHTHNFSWVTVQEATTSQDGIEEYRCDCGMVEEKSIIPSSQVYVKGLYGAIKNAPENGEATFDSGKLYTISDYIIKKLQERSDVKTIITFEYQNAKYKMTIPAGVDYTKLLEDQYYFYGYFYFANEVGATVESL